MPLNDYLSPTMLALCVTALSIGLHYSTTSNTSELITQVRQVWVKGDTRVATFFNILSGYGWAFFLAFPGDTLSRPTYQVLRSIAPEWMWVFIFSLVASLQVWRLCVRQPGKTLKIELVIKMLALLVWVFVALSCLTSQWPIAAAMTDTGIIALGAIWDFSRYDPCRICNSWGRCGVVRCPYEYP